MKNSLFYLVMAVSLLISAPTPVESQNAPKKIWQKDTDRGTPSALVVTKTNNYITATRGYASIGINPKINFLDNDNINWSQESGMVEPNGAVDMNLSNDFLAMVGDTIVRYDYRGSLINKIKLPDSTKYKFLGIFKDSIRYFVAKVVSNDSTHIFVYDNNLSLTTQFMAKGKVQQIASKGGYIFVANSQSGGGTFSSTSSDLSKYDCSGDLVWTKHFPNQFQSRVCVGTDGYVYYAGVQLLSEYPSQIWNVVKFDTDSNQIWSRYWTGDMLPLNHFGLWIYNIIDLPSGGCIVMGSVTHIQDPASPDFDPNLYNPMAIAFDGSGEISWKIREQSSEAGNFRYAQWDKDKYLIIMGDLSIQKLGGIFNRVWKYSVDGVTTVVRENKPLPENFSLSQNYPNPFNPKTTIEFQVAKSGFVSLKVYDIMGREIATLVNEGLSAGSYKAPFDGSRLSSGVYFYTLQTDGFAGSKKMILAK